MIFETTLVCYEKLLRHVFKFFIILFSENHQLLLFLFEIISLTENVNYGHKEREVSRISFWNEIKIIRVKGWIVKRYIIFFKVVLL